MFLTDSKWFWYFSGFVILSMVLSVIGMIAWKGWPQNTVSVIQSGNVVTFVPRWADKSNDVLTDSLHKWIRDHTEIEVVEVQPVTNGLFKDTTAFIVTTRSRK